jgi:hypothetical protein
VSSDSTIFTLHLPSCGAVNSQCGNTIELWCTASKPPSDWLIVWMGKVQIPAGRENSRAASSPSHSSIRPIRSEFGRSRIDSSWPSCRPFAS